MKGAIRSFTGLPGGGVSSQRMPSPCPGDCPWIRPKNPVSTGPGNLGLKTRPFPPQGGTVQWGVASEHGRCRFHHGGAAPNGIQVPCGARRVAVLSQCGFREFVRIGTVFAIVARAQPVCTVFPAAPPSGGRRGWLLGEMSTIRAYPMSIGLRPRPGPKSCLNLPRADPWGRSSWVSGRGHFRAPGAASGGAEPEVQAQDLDSGTAVRS